MRASLTDLLAKLYVFRNIDPYDAEQWSMFNEELQISCSAEVRVNGYADQIDSLEAQVIVTKSSTINDEQPSIKQICYIQAERQKNNDYKINTSLIRGADKAQTSIYNWGEKSCHFFSLVAQEIEKGNLPDFEELEKIAFEERGRFADKWGDGDSRTPKINTELLMKAGRGF